jgi:hypothetical protein
MTKAKKTQINTLDEIPSHFDSEDAERDWWAAHSFSAKLLASLPPIDEDDWDDLQSLKRQHFAPDSRKVS